MALWDIKGKARGVPIYELFGGPTRDRQRVYWSHCGTSRARNHDLVGAPPIDSYQAFTNLGREVASRGFTALKTNAIIPGTPARTYGGGLGGPITDQTVPVEIVRHLEKQLQALTEGTGPDVEIALDLNFHYKPEAAVKICRVAEQFNMLWVELDMYEPHALREVKDGTLAIPPGPAWGVSLDQDVARAHVWEPGRGPGFPTVVDNRGDIS